MQTKVFNFEGKAIDEIMLNDAIFARPWNPDLVHQAVLAQESNQRKIIAHAKNRAEVRGGGKKPWRQKGTGRARHGSIRSPIWKGGGVAHGPVKDKIYTKKLNKKMKRAALHSALSKKLNDQELRIMENLEFKSGKTKDAYTNLARFFANNDRQKISALLVLPSERKTTHRAIQNIPKVKGLGVTALNVRDLLTYKYVLIDREAVKSIS